MKYFFANLKRFDIPVTLGGVNRLAPVQEWGASIVRQTEPFVNSLYPRACCTLLLPEAHLLSALAARAEALRLDVIERTLRSNGVTSSGNTVPLATDLKWGDVASCGHTSLGIAADCNGVPLNAIRYDSPTFGGFSVSASWGEDDFWDVAARYAGEFNGIKVAVAAAYSHAGDENDFGGGVIHRDSDYFQIGAFIHHVPTGLFVYGAYGTENNNNVYASGFTTDDTNHWYLKAGLRRKWNHLGHTVMYGEYANHDDMYSIGAQIASGGTITGSELRRWGLGVVQEIDAAAMSMWLAYRNMDGEFNTLGGKIDLDQIHMVKFGALINF